MFFTLAEVVAVLILVAKVALAATVVAVQLADLQQVLELPEQLILAVAEAEAAQAPMVVMVVQELLSSSGVNFKI
jgi:hypothetical protein